MERCKYSSYIDIKFRFFFLFLIGHTNLSQQIPDDKTGNFDKISDFLEKNWKIARWAALGAIVLQVRQTVPLSNLCWLSCSFDLYENFTPFAILSVPNLGLVSDATI